MKPSKLAAIPTVITILNTPNALAEKPVVVEEQGGNNQEITVTKDELQHMSDNLIPKFEVALNSNREITIINCNNTRTASDPCRECPAEIESTDDGVYTININGETITIDLSNNRFAPDGYEETLYAKPGDKEEEEDSISTNTTKTGVQKPVTNDNVIHNI